MCGAALLNKRFELILKEALGIKDQTEPLPKTLERTFQHAMKHFETELKRNFASETEPDPIPCNGAADNEEVKPDDVYQISLRADWDSRLACKVATSP